jgi:glucose/arabinose dehydrogenase
MPLRAALRWSLVVLMAVAALQGCAQPAPPEPEAPETPLVFDTYTPGPCSPNGQSQGNCVPGTLVRVRLVPVAEGLTNPRHIAFLPGSLDLLVAELPGELSRVRDGSLDAELIAGWPVPALQAGNLHSVLVHPEFTQNGFVYLYYVKTRDDGMTTMALARGRLQDTTLSEVEEVFVAQGWEMGGPIAGRAAFGPDGHIYLTFNDHDRYFSINDTTVRVRVQDLGSAIGKVMRVTDDGGSPPDNPFVNRAGALPEVYTYGHRNVTGLAWHPTTGDLWSTEVGPMGGDELNILRAGQNYGWPLVSLGKLYNTMSVSDQQWFRPGMEMPVMYWTPSISPSSLTFYTGSRFPLWQGHLFVGALNGQMLERVAFDQPEPQGERREALFLSLGRRFRHVVQGPDDLLYVSTERRALGDIAPADDATSGVIYRIEPAE